MAVTCTVCGQPTNVFDPPPTFRFVEDPDRPGVIRSVLDTPLRADPETGAVCWCPTSTSDTDESAINVTKSAAYLQVSCCLLTDATGTNHCHHPAQPSWNPTLRQRLRNRWYMLRYRLGLRLGSWIAGMRFVIDVDQGDDR